MEEIVKLAITLAHEGSKVVPWLLFVLVCWMAFYYRDSIKNYISERAKVQRSMIEREGERLEITRNNTAALNNNTVALEVFGNERDKLEILVNHHEEMSKERFNSIQDSINKCNDDISSIRTELAVVSERVNK